MPAGPWKSYDKLPQLVYSGALDLDAASFKLALFLSTSNAATLTNDEFADLTNQHATANGYPAGGVALVTPAVTQSGRDSVFKANNLTPAFTASGGSIVFRYRVIYVIGTVSGLTNPLVAVALGDSLDVDVTIPNTNALNEIFDPTNGILVLRGTV